MKGKGSKVKGEHLSGLPGCREGELPGRECTENGKVCLCSMGLETAGK